MPHTHTCPARFSTAAHPERVCTCPSAFDPGPAPSADDLIAAQETLEAYDGREEDVPADAPGLTILGMPIGDREDSFGALLGDDAGLTPEQQTLLDQMRAAQAEADRCAHAFLQTLTEEQQTAAWDAVAESLQDADSDAFPVEAADNAALDLEDAQ